MAIFGTSKSEEEALRSAALQNDHSQELDRIPSSAYETASEYNYDLEPEGTPAPNQEIINKSPNPPPQTNPQSAVTPSSPLALIHDTSADDDKPQEFHGQDNESYTEDRLNRIASRSETFSDIERSLSRSRSHDEWVDPKDLDWDGPDDKDNAMNWPVWKKWFVTFTVANVCLCVSLGSSLYVAGVPEIMFNMNASQTLCLSGLTFYLIGLALGPLFTAPLSEMIGRRWIYVTSLPIAMLFTMGVGLSTKIREILVLRFFAGYLASPPMSVAAGTISDIWGNSPADMSIAMALFCVAPFLGPVIGPIVGSFAAEHKGWKWTQWVTLMFCGAILPFVFLCPETYKPAILKARAKKRGVKLIKTKVDAQLLKTIVQVNLVRPMEMLVVEPIVLATSMYTAFVFAVLFGFFEAFPIIFRGVYEMDIGVSGLPFIGVGVGLVGGVALYIAFPHRWFFPKQPDGSRGKRDENGNMIWDPPETRIVVAEVASVFLPIALFWMGWTARKSVHWIAPTLAGVPFGFGLIWIFFGVILYYSMSFPPQFVASAVAANNLLRYVMASVFPLFTVQMYERLHIDWASSLFGFIAIAMVPIPFALHKWGARLRQKSKYGYAAFFKTLAAKYGPETAAALLGRPTGKPAAAAPAENKEAENSNVANSSTDVEDSNAKEGQDYPNSEENEKRVANAV